MPDSPNESIFSPRRWFIAPDDHLRAFWRAFIFLFLAFIVVLLISGVLHPDGEGIKRAGWSAGLLLLSWMLLSTFDRRSFRSLGLWFYPAWWKEALAGIAFGAVLIVAVFAGMVLTGAAELTGLSDNPGIASAMLQAAFFFFTAALFEELVFRGYPFQRLVDSFGALGAVLALSVLFGVGHIGNPGATALSTANTVLAGVLLAQAYLKTRGLWLPLGLHWSWNYFLGPVFALPVSGGKFEPSLINVSTSGPIWLSGGNYGPEGSIVLTIVCTAAIIGLWKAPWISPSPAMQDVLK